MCSSCKVMVLRGPEGGDEQTRAQVAEAQVHGDHQARRRFGARARRWGASRRQSSMSCLRDLSRPVAASRCARSNTLWGLGAFFLPFAAWIWSISRRTRLQWTEAAVAGLLDGA
jgi:hypothetical protein